MLPRRHLPSSSSTLRTTGLLTIHSFLLVSLSCAFCHPPHATPHSHPHDVLSSSFVTTKTSSGVKHHPPWNTYSHADPRSSRWTVLHHATLPPEEEEEEEDHGRISVTPTKVGIAGAGAVAFATATLLATRGHDPMLWSPSGAGTSDLLLSRTPSPHPPDNNHNDHDHEEQSHPLSPVILKSSGAIERDLNPRIASTVQELLESNAVIVMALPANGHVQVMDAMAPHIRSDHILIISSHSSLGAVYLTQLLSARGITIPVVAWGTTVATARQTSGTSVQICTVRTLVDMCTVPDSFTRVGLEMCQHLFGDRFQLREGLLAISLSNLNAQNHLGIALGNMSRMERGESWSQGRNITPNIGRLLEALDQERLEIAHALGFQVRTIYEHFQLSFHVPISSVSEMNQAMVAKGNDVNGPNTPDSRYVTEDVPFGLTLLVALGKLTGRPATLHEAGIQIMSAMYGQDFGNANGLLQALHLDNFQIDDIRKAGQTGLLTCQKEPTTEAS
mmetsp:Transcript_940/g.1490  ORF Transcript_940/g.1490 Transcript_940/m.1490 type:complete len:503 (-) Transcript_940:403-1911(-)